MVPTDRYNIPVSIDDSARDAIHSLLEKSEMYNSVDSSNRSKVDANLCSAICKMYENGMSAPEITDIMPYEGQSTTMYHVNNKCSHKKRDDISYDECGWMIYYARQGAPSRSLAVLYNVTKAAVARHVTGRCTHEHGIEPLDSNELRNNSKPDVTYVEDTCKLCGDTFSHPSWRDRDFCSKKCAATYQSKAYHGKLDE